VSSFVSTFVVNGYRFVCRKYKKDGQTRYVYVANGCDPIFSQKRLTSEEIRTCIL